MLEQLPGLGGREPQLGHAQFGQLAACPQPRQRQRRVAAAGQHHAGPGRPVLGQERERLVHLRRADHVVIVEDQQGLIPGQVVDQRRDQPLERRRRGRTEQRRHPPAGPGAGPVERGHRVPPEPGRVVVPRVQRQPGNRPPAAPGPVRQQDRLAVSGRGAGQDQPSRQALIEPCHQPRPRHLAWARPGQVQLGGQQGIALCARHRPFSLADLHRSTPPRSSASPPEGPSRVGLPLPRGRGPDPAIALPWSACSPTSPWPLTANNRRRGTSAPGLERKIPPDRHLRVTPRPVVAP